MLHGDRFYFRWITIRMKQQPDLVFFFSPSLHLPDNPTTTQTSSVLLGAQALDDTRNKSNTFQGWVSFAMRLLEHHEEFAKTCFAAGSSVFKAPRALNLPHHAGCAASCGLLGFFDGVSKRPQERHLFAAICNRSCRERRLFYGDLETLTSEMQCFQSLNASAEVEATHRPKRATDTQWVRNCVNEQGFAPWSTSC